LIFIIAQTIVLQVSVYKKPLRFGGGILSNLNQPLQISGRVFCYAVPAVNSVREKDYRVCKYFCYPVNKMCRAN